VPPDSTTVTVLALGFAAFALVLVVVLARRLGRLERASATVLGRSDVAALRAEVAQARADVAGALRHVAVVRYDAFGDVGGRLSFSVALLDDDGDGVVLTSIAGRSETRTYAKGVVDGGSEHALSPEERDAIDRARAGRAPVEPVRG
jgi:hypothetical protein